MSTLRPLLIGPETRAEIEAIIKRATENVVPLDVVMSLAGLRKEGVLTWSENAEDYSVMIPYGYRATYTHEEQRQCVCRHLSLSLAGADEGMCPSEEATALILDQFGFKNTIGHMPMWMTVYDGVHIIEFLEPLDGNCGQLQRMH